MITYSTDGSVVRQYRTQRSILAPFGWYFVLAMIAASTMGGAVAFAT